MATNEEKSSETEKIVVPFEIQSILQLAWGLSMNFSHEESQQTLGSKFYDSTSAIFKRFSPDALNTEKPISVIQKNNEAFVINIMMALSKTSRNLGFVRDTHIRFIDSEEKKLEKQQKFFDNISSFSTISKEGLISKIASFVGVGSISSVIKNLIIPMESHDNKIENSEEILSVASDENKSNVFTNSSTEMTNHTTVTETIGSLFIDPNIFVIFGILSIVGLIISTKVYVNKMSQKNASKIKIGQTQYWRNNFIPEASEHLYFLYKDINCLLGNYYDKKTQEDLNEKFQNYINTYGDNNIGNLLPHHLSAISKDEKKILFFIQNQILPHYHQDLSSHHH